MSVFSISCAFIVKSMGLIVVIYTIKGVEYGSTRYGRAFCTDSSALVSNIDDLLDDDEEFFSVHKESATLCIESTVTFFDSSSSSEWLEESRRADPDEVCIYNPPAPILKHLEARKKADIIIECEGVEFPAHSLVLGCKQLFFGVISST